MDTLFEIDSARLKLTALERQGDAWLAEHLEAEARQRFEDFVSRLNDLFGEVFELDIKAREEHLDSGDYNAELSKALEVLFLKCYFLAMTAERLASWFEKKGHAVEGADALRDGLRELEACNKPGDEVPEWLEEKRLVALEDHRQGKTLPGWAG